MSRARLFQRAASWLKNCIQTQKQLEDDKNRHRAFQFAFGQLEERVVLDADFSWDGSTLFLSNFLDGGTQELTVTDTGTHYEFSIVEGNWRGLDTIGEVEGDGTQVLSVDKTFGGTSITSNAVGIDTVIDTINFDDAGSLTNINFVGDAFTQTGGITATTVGHVMFDGSDVGLDDGTNDFGTIKLTADDATVADANDIALSDINVANSLGVTAGGNILLDDDIDVPVLHFNAGDGVSQTASTFLEADELLLEGTGEFDLPESNRIGDAFTTGKVAADIAGSLTLNNNFDFNFDELSHDGTTITGVTITDDLTVTTSQDDVSQSTTGSVAVGGLASFHVGVGSINLAIAGPTNDFNEVTILAADEADLKDGTDGMTLLGSNVDDQIMVDSAGLVTIMETINAGARLFVDSADGVSQEINSVINAKELIVKGTGDFDFEQENNIQNLGGIGEIAVEVTGSFILENGVETSVEVLSYTTIEGGTTEVVGVNIDGDFEIILPDADFSQSAIAPFIVTGTSTFNLGTGCLELTFGDSNIDVMNDNDFGIIEIDSAELVDVVDSNGFLIGDSVVSDRARFEAETGTIVIDETLRVTNQILFVSNDGMAQNLSTNIETPEVLFYGAGDFVLDQLNSIGNSGTPGQIAAMIDGSLEIKNDFGINIANLSYENKDTSTVEIIGVTMVDTTGSGNITFDIDDSTVTQDADAPIVVAGLTTFDVGTLGTVDLSFADAPDDDELDINENDFNTVAVDNGNTIEIVDINTVTIVGAFTNNKLSVITESEGIILDGNLDVANLIKLDSANGVTQSSGVIDSFGLLVLGDGYFDFTQQNELGTGLAGVIAADIDGSLNLVNADKIQVATLSYTDLNSNTFTAIGIGSGLSGGVDQARLKADGIELLQRTEADVVVFESTGGISQQDTQTTDGLIDARDFSLSGSGFANLVEDNLIGSNLFSGDVSIDWSGDVRLNSLFGIDFDAVTFTFKSGTTRVDEGITVVPSGGTLGSFELFTGGDITDAADIHTNIGGIASFIADNGNADIVLGDHFSNSGGPNNIVHFGSIGFKANNADVSEDGDMNLDGIILTGDLEVSAFGHIIQNGSDPFANVGTSVISVEGHSTFVVDSDTAPTDHFDDDQGRDVMLYSRDNDELIDNLFTGGVTIAGTSNTGGLNGLGTLRSISFRNASFEVSAFPTIQQTADPLRSLNIWAPRSSVQISQDLDILGNFVVFAGVDSVNGKSGASLELTDPVLNRRISDVSGTGISVGGNAVFETGNAVALADNASDSLIVGGKLQASTHGGEAGSRIRIGVAGSGNRGDDSGAVVQASQLRFRAKPTVLENSEHATFNIDSDVEIVGPNVARSLMLVVDGNITDDPDADMNIKNSASFVATGDIHLGESFSTNFIDNNVLNFGTLALRAQNVNITEDSAMLLDGVNVSGNLMVTAKGHIRQTGVDRFGQVGTGVIHVDGNATFQVDKEILPFDELNDTVGQDVKIMANSSKELIDNVIHGEVIVTSTAFSGTQNQRGSVRNVEIRNTSTNAKDPIFNLAGADVVRNLHLWVTNTGLNLRNGVSVANDFRAFVGVDSVNGLRNGRLQVVDNSALRNLTDSAGVILDVGRNLDFRVSNRMLLADDAADVIQVNRKSTFITLGGGQGNGINVGTDINAARGTDSGAIFETSTLKYRAPIMGNFGHVTIVGDQPMSVTPDSQAKSAVILP